MSTALQVSIQTEVAGHDHEVSSAEGLPPPARSQNRYAFQSYSAAGEKHETASLTTADVE